MSSPRILDIHVEVQADDPKFTQRIALYLYIVEKLLAIADAKTFSEASSFIIQLTDYFHRTRDVRCDGQFSFKFKEFSVPAQYNGSESEIITFVSTPTSVKIGTTFRLFDPERQLGIPVSVPLENAELVRSGEFSKLFENKPR